MELPLKVAVVATLCGSLGAIQTFYMDDNCGQTIDFTSEGLYDMRLKLTNLSSYSPYMDCTLTLATRNNYYFMLYFLYMSIAPTIGCRYDWLEVHDGPRQTSPYVPGLPGPQCGGIGDSVYTTSGSNLTLYFASDGQIGWDGFDMILTTYHLGSCHSDEYRCSNGRCISEHSACKGYNQCGDKSDCPMSAGEIALIVIGSLIGFSVCVGWFVVCRKLIRTSYHRHVVALVTQGGDYEAVRTTDQPVQQTYPKGPASPPASSQ